MEGIPLPARGQLSLKTPSLLTGKFTGKILEFPPFSRHRPLNEALYQQFTA